MFTIRYLYFMQLYLYLFTSTSSFFSLNYLPFTLIHTHFFLYCFLFYFGLLSFGFSYPFYWLLAPIFPRQPSAALPCFFHCCYSSLLSSASFCFFTTRSFSASPPLLLLSPLLLLPFLSLLLSAFLFPPVSSASI
jgi:hypothetical protein